LFQVQLFPTGVTDVVGKDIRLKSLLDTRKVQLCMWTRPSCQLSQEGLHNVKMPHHHGTDWIPKERAAEFQNYMQ